MCVVNNSVDLRLWWQMSGQCNLTRLANSVQLKRAHQDTHAKQIIFCEECVKHLKSKESLKYHILALNWNSYFSKIAVKFNSQSRLIWWLVSIVSRIQKDDWVRGISKLTCDSLGYGWLGSYLSENCDVFNHESKLKAQGKNQQNASLTLWKNYQ